MTYIPMRRGFLYLVAVMDWATRTVFSWRLSKPWTVATAGRPFRRRWPATADRRFFNTDQGSQFTSREFTGILDQAGVEVSMDGKDCWRDNVLIERLWRSLKYTSVSE